MIFKLRMTSLLADEAVVLFHKLSTKSLSSSKHSTTVCIYFSNMAACISLVRYDSSKGIASKSIKQSLSPLHIQNPKKKSKK